ncbi:MAG: hypothetical protein WCH43_00220, partial [Verrucomicrobiota bacterium]
MRGLIEVKELRNTDFVFLTLGGFKSAQATVDLANLWATEAVQFSRELQSRESHEMRQFLQGQVDATDNDLRKLSAQILEFSHRENLVDADKQIDAYLRALGDLDLKYETVRINLDAMEFKIKGISAELRRQSPLAEKLRTTQAELEELRSHYTDQNPLILEKLEAVKGIEEKMKVAAADKDADPATYARTFRGNTLYLDLIQDESEKKGLIQVSGFTPSDAAHVLDLQANWSKPAAVVAAQLGCRLREMKFPTPERTQAYAQLVWSETVRLTAKAILD